MDDGRATSEQPQRAEESLTLQVLCRPESLKQVRELLTRLGLNKGVLFCEAVQALGPVGRRARFVLGVEASTASISSTARSVAVSSAIAVAMR